RCAHIADCGACQMFGAALREQLAWKRHAVEDELRPYEELDGLRAEECLPSPKLVGYRNRAKMAIELDRSARAPQVRLGYYREGTRSLVDAPECLVLEPALLQTLDALRGALPRLDAETARALRHVDLRCGSDPRRQHLLVVL